MTIQQLEYVIALDTYKHFVNAAEHCYVTQPTLTIQVKKLEDEIGIVLFDRKKHPLETTKSGEKFLLKAKQIIREFNALKKMVSNEKEDLTGVYKIGVIPTIAPYLIPLFVGEFANKHPQTILEFEELKSEEIIDQIKKGSIDIGILVTPLNEPNIVETIMYYEPFRFYGSNDHPLLSQKLISPDQLKSQKDLWLLNKGNCFRNQVINLCTSDLNNENKAIIFNSNSIESVKRMVNHYKGYTLLPELSILKSDKNNRPFELPVPVREVSIICHETFAKEQLIDALRKEILNVVPKDYEKNENFFRVKWR